jgi:molecular chaperone GrpE
MRHAAHLPEDFDAEQRYWHSGLTRNLSISLQRAMASSAMRPAAVIFSSCGCFAGSPTTGPLAAGRSTLQPERKLTLVTSEPESVVDLDAADRTAQADDQVRDAAGAPVPGLTELSTAVRDLAGAAERYHDRAAQREGVIDYLRSELETLRRGERRGMLRPLLTEMCRLRNDLLRQAATLPPDYDAGLAAKLLLSFAESVDLALENNGVTSYTPGEGDIFDPRRHRRLRAAECADPAQAGLIAQVLRDGYLDIEADSPIVLAEVTVFMAVKEPK